MPRCFALLGLALMAQACTLPLQGIGDGGICPGASTETCDGVDEDCDGLIDEALAQTCGDIGTCAEGVRRCVGGGWETCEPRTDWPDEICGGGDEDCDGAVDEGCGCAPAGSMRTCGQTGGECVQGMQICGADQMWGQCTGATGPVPERCDGLDNNCDGTIDGHAEQCREARGICTDGFRTCNMGVWTECDGTAAGPVEICDAAMEDEDCDGMQNELCMCFMGQTQPCGRGSCVGVETCGRDGQYGRCIVAVTGAETCDGVDNDCDGIIDNDAVADCATATECDVVRRGMTVYLFCWQRMGGTDMRSSYDDARAFCATHGYHLVTIDDRAENDFIGGEMESRRRSDFWIGYHDQDDDGMYEWDFGMSTYENWMSAPADDKCASLDSDPTHLYWEDRNCGDSRAFVCEAVPAP